VFDLIQLERILMMST